MTVDMHLFFERDAERQAWKMHGGRDGFIRQ